MHRIRISRPPIGPHLKDSSEKWLQSTLAIHIERDERLAEHLDRQLHAQAIAELRAHFPNSYADGGILQELALHTTRYLEGRIRVPPYSYAWAQPLDPASEKRPVLGVVDPLYAPPKREDTVKCLLETISLVLECEQRLFSALAGEEGIPPYEKPPEAKSSDFAEWNKPLDPTWDSLTASLNAEALAARALEEQREAS